METREVGRTGIRLSVVGFGAAQLQVVPERQAIDAMVRAFERGVNWVHAAPDYGGVEPWVARAIARAGRDVMVLSSSPAAAADLPAFFENTCHVFGTKRLALYGLGGIEDLEWHGQNVWGDGGMIAYLQERKREGRLGGIYCSTHGSPEYVTRLVESQAFDAIMLAWNPLGFHQQSQAGARVRGGRDYEDLEAYRTRIFPLAAAKGVSILVMKPFAGGLLCRSAALPPHDWFAPPGSAVPPSDLLRLALEQPGVCAVLPGMVSVDEADENARAGHAPVYLSTERRARIDRAVAQARTSLCSRCGECEPTCSRGLPIAAMFRDAYIWTLRNEPVDANPAENYFDLHPDAALACGTCTNRTCVCPQKLDIPVSLGRIHERMLTLRSDGYHPGPSAAFESKTLDGPHRARVQTAEVPATLHAGAAAVVRCLVENAGERRWIAGQHALDPDGADVVRLTLDGQTLEETPLRNTVHPGQRSPIALELRAPARPGRYRLDLSLVTPRAAGAETTMLLSRTIAVAAATPAAPPSLAPSVRVPRYGVAWVDHSIPSRMPAGVTMGVHLTIENTGTVAWPGEGQPNAVDVRLVIDGSVATQSRFRQSAIHPGGTGTVHAVLRAPDAGPHRVVVEMWQGAEAFLHDGVEPLQVRLQVDAAAVTETARLSEIARRRNPWYYNPTAGIGASRDGRTYPLFVARAAGCRLWDTDGREYIDYAMGWGSTLLGHAHPRVQDAIRDVLDTGAVPAMPHPIEMEVTERLCEEWPSAEMVLFGKNGSDVCTVAARLARLTTGKQVILSCGFHGWQDFALDYFTFRDSGIPDRPSRTLHKFRFNDAQGFLELYDRCRDDLAAIMIEPGGPLISQDEGLGAEPDPAFLPLLEDAARRAGALLIFDEIITGFRYRQGSVQKATGIIPDLTCLGKALASGMPLAALVGRERIFLDAFHRTHYCPTFKAEVYSLAAARAAIDIYRTEPVVDHVWRYGEALREAVHAEAAAAGIEGVCTGAPFKMVFVFREPDPYVRRLKRTVLMQELLKEGIVTVTGMMLPSYAHGPAELAMTRQAFSRAFGIVADATRRGTLAQTAEIPLL